MSLLLVAAAVGVSSVVIPLSIAAYLVMIKNYNKAGLLYLLYARSPLGSILHNRALKASAQKRQNMSSDTNPLLGGGGASKLSRDGWNISSPRSLVRTVPFLSDNYAYLVVCKATHSVAVVDPADPKTVWNELVNLEKDLGVALKVTSILTTHYHADHAGGNTEFARLVKENKGTTIEVVGGKHEQSPPGVQAATHLVQHEDVLRVGDLQFVCLEVPCHTWGSVLFVCREENLCFTGDFLFSAGCGRFFEGGAKDFCTSLSRSVTTLPDEMLMFCGHEYTVSNLKFAQRVLPEDKTIAAALDLAVGKRENGIPTIPSRFGDERRINVFMRAGDPTLTDSTLVERTKSLIKSAGELKVVAGSDRASKSTATVTLADTKPDHVSLVRALRALKDRG